MATIPTVTDFLHQQAETELSKANAFGNVDGCQVVDIRLARTLPTNHSGPSDSFLVGYGPDSGWDASTADLPGLASSESGRLAALSRAHSGRILIINHQWVDCADKQLPFGSGAESRDFFRHLGLDGAYLWDLARKNPLPLIKYQRQHYLQFTCQTPHFKETTLSFTASWDKETKTTVAFVAFCGSEMQFFMEKVRKLAHFCDLPLLMPTAFYWTIAALLTKRLEAVEKRLVDVMIQTGKLKHVYRGQEASRERNIDQLQGDLVEQHFELTRGLAEYLQDFEANISRMSHYLARQSDHDQSSSRSLLDDDADSVSVSEDDIEHLASMGQNLTFSHAELNRLIHRLHFNVRSSLLKRQRFLDRIPVQMSILYNLKQTQIAEATYVDAAAMKALALLTIIFLPPTALATIFGANNFFQANDGTVDGVTSTFTTVFLPLSIMAILSVMAAFLLYAYWYDVKDFLGRRRRRSRAVPYRHRPDVDPEDHVFHHSLPMRDFPIKPERSRTKSKHFRQR